MNAALLAFALLCALARGVGAEEILLRPGDDIQAAIEAHAEGTVFRLAASVWRRQILVPKDRQAFVGEDGATLDGSVELGDWRLEDGLWVSDGLPETSSRRGLVKPGRDVAQSPEDLFLDGTILTRVGSRADLAPGRWYGADGKVHLLERPDGHLVELSLGGPAIGGAARGVRLENLVVRRYATRAQEAAIDGGRSVDWQLVSVQALWNHGVGLRLGRGMRVEGGSFSHNGQLGIGGDGRDGRDFGVSIVGAEIAGNNYAGFAPGWEAGGIKVLQLDGIAFRDNRVYANAGPGVWLDTDVREAVIENNCIRDNDGIGIQYETSSAGLIRGNVVSRNGRDGYRSWLWGAAILIQNSSDVTVEDNKVVVGAGNGIGLIHQAREQGAFGAHATARNRVRHNTIVHLGPSGSSGIVADAEEAVVRDGGNLFDENRYVLASTDAPFWRFLGVTFTARGFAELQTLGFERAGEIIRSIASADCN